jgi:FHS family L-fucose permease-like MFS transporter
LAVPFVLVTGLFFLWGVPNNLNDILIRQFMKSFALSRFQAGLVQSAFYLGYFLLATPAALLMRRWGYKAGILIGLLLFGSGAILFWPAALAGRYSSSPAASRFSRLQRIRSSHRSEMQRAPPEG